MVGGNAAACRFRLRAEVVVMAQSHEELCQQGACHRLAVKETLGPRGRNDRNCLRRS
jgi:hypothetical protein